jgi:hypothetical protein
MTSWYTRLRSDYVGHSVFCEYELSDMRRG